MECQPLHAHSFPQRQLLTTTKLVFQGSQKPNRVKPMVPNLELIALACLHGSFMALIFLIVISIVLVVFFLSSSLALFSVFVGDLYDAYSVLYLYYEELKGVIELSVCVVVYGLMRFGVDVVLGVKSFVRQQNQRFSIGFSQKKVKEKWRIGNWHAMLCYE